MKKLICCLFIFFFSHSLFAQIDSSCNIQVSLLTCTPGQELYSTFGHSALRVTDSAAGKDLIYNYGTFDFDDPSFYSKFIRGKLLYFVSVDTFQGFTQEYEYERRGITQQVLNLSCQEKEKLVAALQQNAKEENKYYKYDFISDNCTTRLRDIVFNNANGSVVTKNILPEKAISFRNLIHEYLNKGGEYWSELGIDILLGYPLDKKISTNEAMFLPDNLLKAFDSTTIDKNELVSRKTEVLKSSSQLDEHSWFTPFIVFSILFFLVLVLSFFKSMIKILSVFDFILFFITGLLGILLLFMWFGTDHPECKNNFNLLWAMPLHFIIVFFIYTKRKWVSYYFLAYSILLLLVLICWNWLLPQEMNNSLLPLVGLLLMRSFLRYKKLNYAS